MEDRILKGIRIIEFGWAVVGPLTTSWAGNYGGEVIKIETKTRPDIIRAMTPFKDDQMDLDNSLFFGRENASKQSLALNLKHPQGVELAKRLVSVSDIVLDSYTAGVMDKLGLGYDNLCKAKPDLIMISSCMFGQTGTYRSMPGYGVPLTAVSGLTCLAGWPDRAPAGPYGAYTDYLVPRLNLLGIMAALDHRRRTGQGTYLDASQLEACVQFMTPALLEYAANCEVPGRLGDGHSWAAPHGFFACAGKDEWCAISVFSQDQWAGLKEAMESPAWSDSPEFATPGLRKEHEDKLHRFIREWTAQKEAAEVMRLLQAHGVPAGKVNKGSDLANDPQLVYDGYYRELEHPRMGKVHFAPHSIEFSDSPQQVSRSPCLGEHTRQVCLQVLGLSDEEYNSLAQQGVFE